MYQQNPIGAHVSPHVTPGAAEQNRRGPEVSPVLLLAVDPADAQTYSSGAFTRLVAQSTADAVQRLNRERPRIVVIDWDVAHLDGAAICAAAAALPATSVLVTTASTERVPAILKAGCHAVLLKPFARNLLAARLGRLLRERPVRNALASRGADSGTNRVWPGTTCPQCHTAGATSFDFSSHRRAWYACLACESVWLGARQE